MMNRQIFIFKLLNNKLSTQNINKYQTKLNMAVE